MTFRQYFGLVKRRFLDEVYFKMNSRYRLNYRNRGLVNFIDIGSIGGLPEPWRRNASSVRFLLNFEPNESPARNANSLTFNTAVWESDKRLPFYIYKGFNKTGSSLFRQNFAYVEAHWEELRHRGPAYLAESWHERSALIETIELECRALDGILGQQLPETKFHFMKVDAQGAEFNILNGAKELLAGSCCGLHLELFSLPLYEGIVLLDEVSAFLADFDFRLVKKFPAHGSFDSQNDCLFLKNNADRDIMSTIERVYRLI